MKLNTPTTFISNFYLNGLVYVYIHTRILKTGNEMKGRIHELKEENTLKNIIAQNQKTQSEVKWIDPVDC